MDRSTVPSQTPQPQRGSGGFPRSPASHALPTSTTPCRLPEGESAPPEPPAPHTVLPPKIFYIKQEPFEPKEEISGGGTQSGGTKEETKVFPGGNTEENGELGFLLPSGAGQTSGGGGPSWKPVDRSRSKSCILSEPQFLHPQNGCDTIPECGCNDAKCNNTDDALSTVPGIQKVLPKWYPLLEILLLRIFPLSSLMVPVNRDPPLPHL